MNTIDLKLKLFSGRAIFVDGYGSVAPLTIGEIIDIGYSEYLKLLNIMTLDSSDFIGNSSNDLNVLELILNHGGNEVEEIFEKAVSCFLHGDVVIDKEDLRIFVKHKNGEIDVVNKDNYSNIQEVIRWQNYINNFEEKPLDKFNPADEETRQLKEQMDEIAKRRDKLKKKNAQDIVEDTEDIDFYDILSSISSKSYGINELNVSELTIYQVYRKFKRLELIDQYDISIKSILAGARDVHLRHWSSKA